MCRQRRDVPTERGVSQHAPEMIKTRLRNALSQDNLEAHMLLNLNRQWTQEIDDADIMQKMCDNST